MLHLRDQAPPAPGRSAPLPAGDERADLDRLLVCARCGTPITSAAERVSRDGGHEHVKVNPHGLMFRIGCFRSAVNLLVLGAPERAWSWFAGCSWQAASCAGCGSHLGWLFSSDTDRFHGLLLDGLVEGSAGP